MAEVKIGILRIIARLNVGGPAIHVVNLNAFLDPSRYRSKLIAGTENLSEGSLLHYALSHGVKPITVPEMVGELSLKPRDLRALTTLYRVIRAEKPHIVHTHTTKAGFLGRLAARLTGVPIVVHTFHGHLFTGYYGSMTSYLLRSMEGSLAKFSDCLIAVSRTVRNDLIRYAVAPPEKISVIPLGFDLRDFLGCESHRGQFRAELKLNDEHRLVGIVGRIFPVKNHKLFLDAAARVASRERKARFVIVGDGILRSEMEIYAEQVGVADCTVFTGWRRDLARVYADLDALVISSRNEGTPVSAIEAMASARPVVATRVGGLPDLIEEGKSGYLVPPDDPDQLAQKILALIDDREAASRFGEYGRKVVQERFSLPRLIADMDRLYQTLLRKKGVSCVQ